MEYIRVGSRERMHGQRELLQSQIEILTILKRYQKYKTLRKQELDMKNAFNRLVSEVQEEMKILDKHLPHVHKAYLQKQDSPREKPTSNASQETKERNDLEMEIRSIKDKLSSLGY